MKPNTEKKVKPLKKIKALEKQNEIDAQMVKPAVRIQELKNKLIILGHDLKVNKKINDSLYRKIQLLTYSRTTEQKLKDSYKTLKDIENKINNKTDTTEKTKKITVKDFKENKKTVDDDSNVLYNIYIKYKVWFIIDGPSEKDNYKLFIGDGNIEIHTLWEINNHTLQTYGKNNIIDKIKDFLEIALSNPYTHKIKVLDVHVNKEIYQPKQYRYLGAIKRTKYIKGKDGRIVDYKDYIQYFKAWNATFTYKGFNLDMNNDIEFECVPNALFKTYGTKKEVSNQYLHSVHKGGLDYVKNVLNRESVFDVKKLTENKHVDIIQYVNPYDEMIKDAEKMIKEYINQYEYDQDYAMYETEGYEFNVDDVKDEKIKNNIKSLYKSIDEYTEQKN